MVRDQMTMVDVFTVADALDGATCRWVQASMDAGTRDAAEILNDAIEVEEGARRAAEIDVPEDVIARLEACFDARRDAIAAFYGMMLHAREGAGFLRYEAGGFYGPHVDRANVPSWPAAARRAITIVLFLNTSCDADPTGEFAGGCLRIFPSGLVGSFIDVVPRRGVLVAFPASMPHEVTPVSGGRRDAVVDWFYE